MKNKIIMWMDENTGKYYSCEVTKNYRVAFGDNIEECVQNIEPEIYEKASIAKEVAKKVVANTGVSALVLHVTKYKSFPQNQTKDKKVKIVHMIMGKNEKSRVRKTLANS